MTPARTLRMVSLFGSWIFRSADRGVRPRSSSTADPPPWSAGAIEHRRYVRAQDLMRRSAPVDDLSYGAEICMILGIIVAVVFNVPYGV